MARWTRHELIKAGGQADIFRGEDESGNGVAIKILRLSAIPDEAADQRRRFDREVKCHLSLDHPGIMKILAAAVNSDEPFFVMPLGAGSLRAEMTDASAGVGTQRTIEIAKAMLDAMVHAHAEGVIHRDLKPDNVVFVGGAPIITDFGFGRRTGHSASATMTRGGLGTEGYAAPEQYIEGHVADERSDIYSLGCIIYEMFTGRRFAAGARWPEVPPDYRYIVMTATNQDPERRFSSAADMAAAIDRVANGVVDATDPADQALELAQKIAVGNPKAADQLLQLLVENDEDANLYLRALPYFDAAVIKALWRESAATFKQVVLVFDGYAEGRHPYSFTDRVATFLCNCFRATDDMELRMRILERLLILGFEHNRFYVGDRFIDMVRFVESDPAYPHAVADLLRANESAIPFVREGLTRKVSNRVITNAVR